MEGLLDEKLKPLNQQQISVSKQMIRLEKFTREKNVIITGIPEDQGDLQTNIETINSICDKIGTPKVMIDDVFRIGKKKDTGNRPILLKLALMVDKKRLLQGAKVLRKEKIYLNEDQTQEERIQGGLLRTYFKGIKPSRPDINFSIRNGVMSIWKDNAIIERYTVVDGAVQPIQNRSI